MSHDLGDRISATLNARAGSAIDAERLVRRALTDGQRIRRRRRVLTTLGTAALAVALTAAALVTPDVSGTDRIGTAAPPLPAATDEAGAATHPELVGDDPAVLHFTADALVAGATRVMWTAGGGTESVQVTGDPVSSLFLLAGSAEELEEADHTLGSSGEPVTPIDVLVGDRPGRAWKDGSVGDGGNWTVDWQPTEGLWARLQMTGSGQPELLAAAATIRFDGAQRCVLPFRLTVVPAGLHTLSCSVTLGSRGFSEGSLLVGDENRWFSLRVERTAPGHHPGDTTDGDLTAGPYQVERGDDRVLSMILDSCSIGLIRDGWGAWANGVTEPEAVSALAGYRQSDDLNTPSTW